MKRNVHSLISRVKFFLEARKVKRSMKELDREVKRSKQWIIVSRANSSMYM